MNALSKLAIPAAAVLAAAACHLDGFAAVTVQADDGVPYYFIVSGKGVKFGRVTGTCVTVR